MKLAERFGLHIRLHSSIIELVERAQRLQLPFFQCFFVIKETGKLVKIDAEEKKIFLQARVHFNQLICHGSYWINLASLGYNGYRALERELDLAKRLEFTHLVLHPGVAKGAENKMQGIDALARALNRIIKNEQEIHFLLENTCHGNLAVGSDILDFKILLEKVDTPERLGFCIDTSHAYSFGYDISQAHERAIFIDFLDTTIGVERIKLIHLNDTNQKLGSRIDKHSIVGEGKIGKKALQEFIFHQKLLTIPVLMEMPQVSDEHEERILQDIRGWRNPAEE